MYRYINDISEIAHTVIEQYVDKKNIAIDCTLGNGYDTDFLMKYFQKIYSFDIQKEPCERYSKRNIANVTVLNMSHDNLKKIIKENQVDCIMYNLGFLPGGNNKAITTKAKTTINSIKQGVELLAQGGIMTICVYVGHDEGKIEESCIIEFLEKLPKSEFAVLEHKYINRSSLSPRLFVIEKNS